MDSHRSRPSLREALDVVAISRGDRVVITTMGSIAVWRELSQSPLDFHYIPSAMGHAPDLGLGLALAKPERGVIVLDGDGSTLMNLGSLVTVANHRVPLYLLIIDNGLYEVTGGQRTAGTGRVDFALMARAAESSQLVGNCRINPPEIWTLSVCPSMRMALSLVRLFILPPLQVC